MFHLFYFSSSANGTIKGRKILRMFRVNWLSCNHDDKDKRVQKKLNIKVRSLTPRDSFFKTLLRLNNRCSYNVTFSYIKVSRSFVDFHRNTD